MADEGEVLSKLEAFLVRHQHVSLVELDALISTVSSTDGTPIPNPPITDRSLHEPCFDFRLSPPRFLCPSNALHL